MSANDHELLEQFAREGSQDAFTEVVRRYLNLVYSAALRQVRSPELAEEVAQTAFTQLARHAARLAPDTILSAWLYQVTRHAAIDVVRSEARRQAREQIAIEMSELNDTNTHWTHIEPLLDEAMQSLDETDRAAILLRYFENKSLREVGAALGASEDAAQKRVSRAIERLQEFFSKRKVAVGASGLAALLSVNAVQAAPAGLLSAVATGAAVSYAAFSASTAIAVTKTIAMTTMQKAIIAIAAAGAVAIGLYQAREVSNLKEEVQTYREQAQQQASLSNRVQELAQERDRATNALAVAAAENEALKKRPTEVLKLRGEVGRLRQENADMGSSSPLSKVTSSPEMRKMVRDQQKVGMAAIYKKLAQDLKLTPDQTGKLNDLLADHIMANVDNVTSVLHDKPTTDQMNAMFASQETDLQGQLQDLLGADGLAKYQDYSKNILGLLSSEQFKAKMSGTDEQKTQKANELSQAFREESQAALASAGLPADYQTVPILQFGNIASEQQADQSLKLLDDIYQRVAARSGGFLSADELKSFDDFRSEAIKNSRNALAINRTMMAPLGK